MKKLCALLLCMIMLLSLVPVAQADVTYPLVETFDDETVGVMTISGVTYRNESPIFGSNYFVDNATDIIEIAENGYKGNCYKITETANNWYQVATESFVSTAEEPVYVNFKLRIDNNADGTAVLPIRLNGTTNFILIQNDGSYPAIYFASNNTQHLPYVVGRWYDFSIKLTPGRADVVVKDEYGNVGSGFRADKYVTGNDFLDFKGAGAKTSVIAGTGISLDEFYVTKGGSAANLVSNDGGTVPVENTTIAEELFNVDSIPNIRNYLANSDVVPGMSSTSYYVDYFSAPVIDDGKGGKAAEITHKAGYESRKGYLDTIKTPLTNDTKVFVSARLKFGNSHYYGIGLTSGSDSNGAYDILVSNGQFKPGGSSYHLGSYPATNFNTDNWYTIIFEFLKDNGVDKANLHIYDDNGTQILKKEGTAGVNAHRGAVNGAMMSIFKGANTPPLGMDDIRIIQTPVSTNAEEFIGSVIFSETIDTTTPVITAKFDKLLSASSTAKFVAGSTEIPAVIKFANPITVEITPASVLDYSTSYTLDLSGIRTNEDLGLATGSITSLAVNTPKYSLGTMTLGDVAVSGTTLTVPVTFANAEYKEVYTNLIAALYDASGNLVWVDFQNVKGATMGANTFTFTGLPEGANVENIKIFAWDNFSSMMPLYR